MKQSSLDEQEQIEMEAQQPDTEDDMSDYYRPFEDSNNINASMSESSGDASSVSGIKNL